MLTAQLDPLTEQQVMGIYNLQRSTEQAEGALSQGLEQLQQSLTDTIASGSVNDSMHHMAVALGKLTNLEGFVRQVKFNVLNFHVTLFICHIRFSIRVLDEGVWGFKFEDYHGF